MVALPGVSASNPRCGSPAVHPPWGLRSRGPPSVPNVEFSRRVCHVRRGRPTSDSDDPDGGDGDDPDGGYGVTIMRRAGLSALLASGVLLLAACGSDNNTTTTTSTAAAGSSATGGSAGGGMSFEGAGLRCA